MSSNSVIYHIGGVMDCAHLECGRLWVQARSDQN